VVRRNLNLTRFSLHSAPSVGYPYSTQRDSHPLAVQLRAGSSDAGTQESDLPSDNKLSGRIRATTPKGCAAASREPRPADFLSNGPRPGIPNSLEDHSGMGTEERFVAVGTDGQCALGQGLAVIRKKERLNDSV
jgi:hypothetical protein